MTSAEHQPTGEELMAYLDGEMPQEDAAAIQSHLASCAVCQRIVSGLKATSAELERWRVEDPPPSLQLPARPRAQTRASWPARLRFRPAMAWSLAGGVAVVWLVTISTFTRSSPKPAVFARGTAEQPEAAASRAGDAQQTAASLPRSAAGGGGGRQHAAATPAAEPAPATPTQRSEGPMIARSATLRIVANRFDDVRPAIDRILRDVKGFAGRIDATAAHRVSRTLTATLRVPAPSLDTALASLKQLGHVVSESQTGDDVTEQVVDVAARLSNARQTESRLTQLLRERTGKVSDVLEAEREISRVRVEIERLDAERTNLDRRVTYATVALEVTEEPKAAIDMGPLPVPTRLRNAFVDGIRSAVESLLGLSLTLLHVGPTLAVWIALLFFPVRSVVRRTWARD